MSGVFMQKLWTIDELLCMICNGFPFQMYAIISFNNGEYEVVPDNWLTDSRTSVYFPLARGEVFRKA